MDVEQIKTRRGKKREKEGNTQQHNPELGRRPRRRVGSLLVPDSRRDSTAALRLYY